MAFRYVPQAWRDALATGYPVGNRYYIDFRQRFFPPLSDTTTYTAVAFGDNQPGEFNLPAVMLPISWI